MNNRSKAKDEANGFESVKDAKKQVWVPQWKWENKFVFIKKVKKSFDGAHTEKAAFGVKRQEAANGWEWLSKHS